MCNTDTAGYGDDITPYSVNKTKKLVINELKKLSTIFLNSLMVTITRPTVSWSTEWK